MQLSVVIITLNEEANIGRTLESVQPLVSDGKGEIIVVDSGSTDRTVEVAKSFGAKVFIVEWKGFAAQKDEEVCSELAKEIAFLIPSEPLGTDRGVLLERAKALKYLFTREAMREMRALRKAQGNPDSFFVEMTGYFVSRKNLFLGRWIKHGGFWPDCKLRLFRKGAATFEARLVHEDAQLRTGERSCTTPTPRSPTTSST